MGTRYKSDWWSIPIKQRLAVAQRQEDQAKNALRDAEALLELRRFTARSPSNDKTCKALADHSERSASALYALAVFKYFIARAEVDRLKKLMKAVKKGDEREPRKTTEIRLPQPVLPAQSPPKQPKPRLPAYPRGISSPRERIKKAINQYDESGKFPVADIVAAGQRAMRQALKDSTSAVKHHPKPEIIWDHILNIQAFLYIGCTEDKDYLAATNAAKEGSRHLVELEIDRLRKTHGSEAISAIGRAGVRVGDYIMAGADRRDNRIQEFYQAAADAIRRRDEFILAGCRAGGPNQKVLDMYEREKQLEGSNLDWFKARGGKWKSLP